MAFNWQSLIEALLVTGETLEPVFIHNAKSQQVATILTTDANAFVGQLLAAQKQNAPTPVVTEVVQPNPFPVAH